MGTYLPSTADERKQMLEDIGYDSFDDLYTSVPGKAFGLKLDLPDGVSEFDLQTIFKSLADKNTRFHSIFRGAGAYWRFRPAIVDSVMKNDIFATAYTPYQAEISQGILQSIFEYQSMNCELCGMDAASASVYDGACAAAEAVCMCQEKKRSRVVISGGVAPQTIQTVSTYCAAKGIEVSLIPLTNGLTDATSAEKALKDDAACLLVQQPNYYGVLEETPTLVDIAHKAGAKLILSCDPVSLGILESPGEIGADICVCEGQSLGLPLSFGGPYLGMISCTEKLMRRLPGRIVGQTQDAAGHRAYVLTLQAREQHIRREKAASNICSNEALCALGAAAYLSAMGPEGLAQAARLSYAKAHYLANELCVLPGIRLVYGVAFFNEFVTTYPHDPYELQAYLAKRGILGGLPVEQGILWCATEMNSKEQIDELVALIKEADL